MKKLKIILIVVLLLVVGFTGYYISESRHKIDYTPIDTSQDGKIIKKERSITGETIKSGINNIGELATAEYFYTHVQNESKIKTLELFDKKIDLPLTESSFVFSYDGTIKAGINFTDSNAVQVEIDEENKKLSIILPKAIILSNEIDSKSYQLYDEKNNIFNPISVTDVTTAFDEMKEEEKEKAISKGLLERAESNAKSLIQNLIKGYGDATNDLSVNIEFK